MAAAPLSCPFGFKIVVGHVHGNGSYVGLDRLRMLEGKLIKALTPIRAELQKGFLNQVVNTLQSRSPSSGNPDNREADRLLEQAYKFQPRVGVGRVGACPN